MKTYQALENGIESVISRGCAMKHSTPRSERYFANFEFKNGASAQAYSGNLRRLLSRIRRNFAGEVTAWEFIGGLPIVSYTVYDQWEPSPYKSRVVASREASA